jgi:hypothetical protein
MAKLDPAKFGIRTLEETAAFAIGGATTPAIEWIIRPIAHRLNSENTNEILMPSDLAIAEIRRYGKGWSGVSEAAKSAIDATNYDILLDTLRTPPSSGEALELTRRGKLDDQQLKLILARGGMDPEWIEEYVDLLRIHLTPADLAMARQQGFINDQEQHAHTIIQGLTVGDADLLFEMSGLPPGAEQMIELWRRGLIDEARVRQALIEGHIKIKYADDVLKLKMQPLSASIAAEALIRQRIPESQAIAIAEKNGITQEDFLLWSNMLGRPIATGQALQLARRGEFTFTQFKEAVARSDVRTEYADDLWKLRRVIPPLFQVSRLLAAGSIPRSLGVKYIMEDGYDAELAHAIADAAGKHKTAKTRDLAATQIDALYESGLETRKWAIDALIGLGYDANEAEWHLELLEAKRLLAALQSDLSLIHRSYVNHKITEEQAQQNLDKLQMRTEARDLLLQTWTNERTHNIARLTNAQIGMALKHANMPRAEAVRRWQENGYPLDDAQWLADIALKTPHGAVSPTP